ncbi:MAG: hypothetical protein EBU90_02570 [Proteobacteria bacterium]|nr:hypothetical protein [Pseudomonadota bacterium]NBP13120.1 hypothetical protein [bacterium]
MFVSGEKIYTVIASGNTLKCVDAATGMQHNTHRFDGTIVSGPIVTGDRVTVVIRRGDTNYGIVFKLPSFLQTSTFRG